MAAKPSRPSTTTAASSSSTSKSKSSLSSSSKPTSLVSSSVKKTLKSAKNKKNNKFRDTQKRELLDGQTSQLFSQADRSEEGQAKQDPFSYGVDSSADQRRTRRQVDEAALALDMLMKS